MSTAAVRARDTPGATATPVIAGVLIIDADNGRARYDCHRISCPQRREGPVYGPAIPEWSTTVRDAHVARYHQGERS